MVHYAFTLTRQTAGTHSSGDLKAADGAIALLACDPADSLEQRNLIRDSAQSKLKQLGAH